MTELGGGQEKMENWVNERLNDLCSMAYVTLSHETSFKAYFGYSEMCTVLKFVAPC